MVASNGLGPAQPKDLMIHLSYSHWFRILIVFIVKLPGLARQSCEPWKVMPYWFWSVKKLFESAALRDGMKSSRERWAKACRIWIWWRDILQWQTHDFLKKCHAGAFGCMWWPQFIQGVCDSCPDWYDLLNTDSHISCSDGSSELSFVLRDRVSIWKPSRLGNNWNVRWWNVLHISFQDPSSVRSSRPW